MELFQNLSGWFTTYTIMPVVFALICGLGFAMVSRRAGMAAFLIVLTLALSNLYIQSKPAFSEAEIAKLNRGLPFETDGVMLERITFSDRTLSYHFSMPGHVDDDLMAAVRRNAVPYICKKLGHFFTTRRLEKIAYVFNGSDGPAGSQITASDCR